MPRSIRHARNLVHWFRILAACAWVGSVGAADDYFAVSWDADDGLPHNGVYRIVQTPDGYLWLGTSGGLARFDGLHFRRIDSPLLRNQQSESVRYMLAGEQLPLLAAPSVGGLFVVDDRQVASYSSHPFSSERIASLYLARDRRLWLSLQGGILCWWKNGEFAKVGRMHTSGSGRVTMAEDGEGVLWLAVGNFFGFWNGQSFEQVPTNLGLSYHLARSAAGIWLAGEDGLVLMQGRKEAERIPWPAPMSLVNTMLETADRTLWVGTKDTGLFRFDGREFRPGPSTHPEISCLLEDRDGNLWAGTTGGGVYLIRRRFVTVFDAQAGLPQDVSFSICEDREGAIWFANRSDGLVRWAHGKFTRLRHTATGLPGATVVSPAADGSIYMGSDAGLFVLPAGTTNQVLEVMSFRGRAVRLLYGSRAGELWVAARSRYFGRIEGTNFIPAALDKRDEAFVSAVAEDPGGALLAGTSTGEVFRKSGMHFEKITGIPEGIALINAIAPHPDGSLWLGTSGSGLVRWRNGMSQVLDQTRGLPDDALSQLIWENETNLWGGSRSGIWRVTLPQLERAAENPEARLYPLLVGRGEGAPGGSCMGSQKPVSFKGRDGRLWFATRRGVARIDPAGFRETPREIPVFLEEFRVDGKSLSLEKPVRAPQAARRCEIRFGAVLLAAAESLRFRYRLEGFDSEWIDAGPKREADYPRLPPGDYRFTVQTRDPRGTWCEPGAVLAFVVPPAWWQRLWVQGILVLVSGGALAGMVRVAVARRYRQQLAALRQKQALEHERARIARDLHDELGAGLTHLAHLGHFPSGGANEAEMRASLAAVSEQARALAVQMDAIVWTVNPKNDTLPQLAGYLSHFAREFFQLSPIRLRLDRPQELPDLPISPEFRHHVLMIVKEALNNAAKHSGASEVWLRLNVQNSQFLVEVEDNGRGFMAGDASSGKGDGLKNMQARAAELRGDLRAGGNAVRLNVPLAEETTAA